MIYRRLGNSKIIVSRICLGVLTIGPLQKNLPLEEGADIVACALEKGINFLDTAHAYRTYRYIKRALEKTGLQPVIASKSYAYTERDIRNNLEMALDEMGLPRLDLFLLHEQENEHTLRGHGEALRYLVRAREKGFIRAVGLSTHAVAGVMAGAVHPDIEVIHPLININGLGILDGSREDMLTAIKYARQQGKGIYAMKVLGGGNLIRQAHQSFQYINNNPDIDSIALGMKSRAEIEVNIAWSEGRRHEILEDKVMAGEKTLFIEDWCHGCGQCISACHQQALSIVHQSLVVDRERCILCGYCSQHCEDFCIKIM